MKITRKQLRKIINESIESILERSDAQKDVDLAVTTSMTAGATGAGVAGLGASAALGLSGVAGPVALVVAAIGAGILSIQTLSEVQKSERKATAQRMNDILKRTMTMTLEKARKKGLSDYDARKAHDVITKGKPKEIEDAIKMGVVGIDLNDLERVSRDMERSASSEYVDSEAIDKMIDELKDKLFDNDYLQDLAMSTVPPL